MEIDNKFLIRLSQIFNKSTLDQIKKSMLLLKLLEARIAVSNKQIIQKHDLGYKISKKEIK